MTYYEWITNLEELKNGPRNDKLLLKLYESNIEFTENTLYRFILHINDLIRTRLKNTIDSVLIKISTVYYDKNALSIEIINIKKELKYAKSIINLPVIPKENKEEFYKMLDNFGTEISEALISSVKDIDATGEIIMMIKNSKISELED